MSYYCIFSGMDFIHCWKLTTHNMLLVLVKKMTFSWYLPRIHMKEWKLHSFWAAALDEGEWSASHCGCFTTMKEPWYSLNRQLGGPQSWSACFGEEKNLLPLMGSDHKLLSPWARLYTECTTPPPYTTCVSGHLTFLKFEITSLFHCLSVY
jgi:hypothetical protein